MENIMDHVGTEDLISRAASSVSMILDDPLPRVGECLDDMVREVSSVEDQPRAEHAVLKEELIKALLSGCPAKMDGVEASDS